jgi:hypothetical protein
MRRKISRIFLFIAFAFLGIDVFPQDTQCDLLFSRFRNDVLIELEANDGRIVWDDETTESHCLLMLSCKEDDLIRFMNDSIPFIRAEMYLCLAKRTSDINLLQDVLKAHWNDSASYINSTTDLVVHRKVNEFMDVVYQAKSSNELKPTDFQARLDRLLNIPRLIIPGLNHGFISKESLLKLDSLFCSLDEFEIVSFDLEGSRRMSSNCNALTKRMKREVRRLEVGDKVYFDKIRVMMPDKTFRYLTPLVLTIR